MTIYKVAVIRGDGIGTEVVEEGLKVLKAVSEEFPFNWEFNEFPWGSEYYIKHGQMMPKDALDILVSYDAIFLGAVGHPDIQDHITLNGLLLPIRRRFDQYVCQRPSILYPGISSPLADKNPYDMGLFFEKNNTNSESLLLISPLPSTANKLPFSKTNCSIPIIIPTPNNRIANKVLYSEGFNFSDAFKPKCTPTMEPVNKILTNIKSMV